MLVGGKVAINVAGVILSPATEGARYPRRFRWYGKCWSTVESRDNDELILMNNGISNIKYRSFLLQKKGLGDICVEKNPLCSRRVIVIHRGNVS